MKLSVRSKVANGLVICLLVPRVAMTAAEKFSPREEGLGSFAADDEFVLGPENGPVAMIRLQADPAGDPSATGDPSGCDVDPSGMGMLHVNAPWMLVTTESTCDPSGGSVDPSGGGLYDPSACVPFGNMKLIEVSMDPGPAYDQVFYVEGTDPSGNLSDEISVTPQVLVFREQEACIPQNIWVTGLNDNVIDGDQPYQIRLYDEQDYLAESVPGINLDNDNYKGVAINVAGPSSMPQNGAALYTVNVTNFSGGPLNGNNLVIEPSPGLAITNYAASLVSNGKFKAKGKLKSGVLTFSRISLDARDELLVSIQVVLFGGGPGNQQITARFEQPTDGLQIDDDKTIRPRLP